MRSVLVDEDLAPNLSWLAPGLAEVHPVQAGVLGQVLDTVTPQPVVALVSWPVVDRPVLAESGPSLVAVLAGVSDPGNVGTVVRTAAAAGASGVMLTEGSADPFGPKAVRASAGAVLRLPIAESSREAALPTLAEVGVRLVVADAHGSVALDDADLTGDVAVVLGNETHGIPAGLAELPAVRVSIPMARGTESLNVAAAGAVILFEAARQRRMGGSPR